MAQIDTRHEALLRLVQRLQKEYGETSIANFALDEQLNQAEAHIQHLHALDEEKNSTITALFARIKQADEDNESLRKQLDPKRGDRFAGPRKKAAVRGADQDQSV